MWRTTIPLPDCRTASCSTTASTERLRLADRSASRVAVLYLDLDGFKLINDTQGHAVGDKLLQSVTARLLACVRDCDTVSRMGGDEFVILLPEVHQAEDTAMAARRILQSMGEPHTIDGLELMVTASIGISLYPDDAGSAGELLANADGAMYEAKSSGRAGYVFYPAVDAGEERPTSRIIAGARRNSSFRPTARGGGPLHLPHNCSRTKESEDVRVDPLRQDAGRHRARRSPARCRRG